VSRAASAPPLSTTEHRAREDARRFADASLGLSGFKVSAKAQARANRFVAGEIDLVEFINGD
jgi:hypothetical protein